ncbi:MAG: DUF6691 family protein [Deltaproteobacteria bacterium]
MSATSPPPRPAAFTMVGLFSGLLFGTGLVVGGMTDPAKVRGFLDFAGAWDPTLVFVMGGAVLVHAVAYRLVKGRAFPVLAETFLLPARTDVDAKLILGAAIFGLGWGVGGYCPGPAIASLPTGGASVVAFVVAMMAGSWATGRLEARSGTRAATSIARADDAPARDGPTR